MIMNDLQRFISTGVFVWGWLALSVSGLGADATDDARLQAVIEFADNVLEKGRDRFGPEPTPLFVDGWNTETDEPVVWVYKGEEWIPSNLASHQNLFRTLRGLSRLTGEARYERAARDAIAYHFDELQSPCGLLYWGGHRFIDLKTKRVVGESANARTEVQSPLLRVFVGGRSEGDRAVHQGPVERPRAGLAEARHEPPRLGTERPWATVETTNSNNPNRSSRARG
jgi:hypothetical protein